MIFSNIDWIINGNFYFFNIYLLLINNNDTKRYIRIIVKHSINSTNNIVYSWYYTRDVTNRLISKYIIRSILYLFQYIDIF